MHVDVEHTISTGDAAVADAAFDAAVRGLAAHRPSAGAELSRALAADPLHVRALALKGFSCIVLAREELVAPAVDAAAAARRALDARGGGTADERVLVEALGVAADGRMRAAADLLDERFADRPAEFLPFKLSHALRFMLGDRRGMLAASTRMMDAWSADLPYAGFLAGCHAFALEEHGRYDEAERTGRLAVGLEPDDAWGLHAVGHVHEMRGETAAGIDWLEAARPSWSRCNNFSFHMAWHLALLHLEAGDGERVLALYDEAVRPEETDDFRDVANAVSLLWRMERHGVDVGDRWDALHGVAEKRRADTTLVFASLHVLLALLAAGDRAGADRALAALEARADAGGDQGGVAAAVGVPLARALAGRRAAADPCLARLAEGLGDLGGSNAQRDVFVLALAEEAARRGDGAALAGIRAVRRRFRADDALLAAVEGRRAPAVRIA